MSLHFLSPLFISSIILLEDCLCLPVWFFKTAVCFVSPFTSPHSSICHLYLSFSFFAQFFCVLTVSLLLCSLSLWQNVPVQRLVKHLYSTFGCVITFNPGLFLFCSLRQRMLFFGVFTDSVCKGCNSCPTSHLFSHSNEWDRQVEVVRRQEFVLTYLPSLPPKRHLLVDCSLAKERGKGNKNKNAQFGQRGCTIYFLQELNGMWIVFVCKRPSFTPPSAFTKS